MDPISPSSLPVIDEATMPEMWRQYEQALSRLSPEQLMAQLTAINSGLQAQSTWPVQSLLEARLQSADQPLVRSVPKVSRPSMDRAAAAASPSLPPSSLDLLSRSQRLGPRLAAKLVLASARAQARAEQ